MTLPLTTVQVAKRFCFRSNLCCPYSHILIVSVLHRATQVLLACQAHTNCKQQKMPHSSGFLGCCQLCLRSIPGCVFRKKNVARASFYSLTVVQGFDDICSVAPPRLWPAIRIVLEGCGLFSHFFSGTTSFLGMKQVVRSFWDDIPTV